MNKIILMSICIFLLIISTSCSNKDVIEENNLNVKKINELENKIEDLQKQVDQAKIEVELSNEEKKFYLEFIEDLTSTMSEDYAIQIAQEQWKYTVLIDNISIPSDGIIEIDKDSFSLTVTEEQTPFIALPLEIHNKGRISGNLFSNHIEFLDAKPSDTTGADETVTSSTTYTFKNIHKNSSVNLRISPELQNRLGINTNILIIKSIESNNATNTTTDGSTPEDQN